PSVADPGSQSPQRLGRARLLSHLTRLNLFQQTSQLQICHTPSFAVNDRAGMRRAPQHVLSALQSAVSQAAAVGSLEGDGGAGSLEGLLGLLGVFLRSAFEDGLGGSVDE